MAQHPLMASLSFQVTAKPLFYLPRLSTSLPQSAPASWPPCCPLSGLSMVLPQGLCMCSSLHWSLFPLIPARLTPSLIQLPLLYVTEAFLDHSSLEILLILLNCLHSTRYSLTYSMYTFHSLVVGQIVSTKEMCSSPNSWYQRM